MAERRLTDEQARAVILDGRPNRNVASEYGVSSSLVRQLKNGRARPHLKAAIDAAKPADPAEWRPVADWPMYEVSNDGRVRNAINGRAVRDRPHPAGYRVVDLHAGKRYGLADKVGHETFLVHVLVCTAFHGPAPTPDHEVAHGNGVKADNRTGNLRWDTRAGNFADKKRHGTSNTGERNGGAKLTAAQVAEIRADPRLHREIAADYDVSQTQISRIKSGKKWGNTP